jgi:hypothetical protein
MRVVDATDAILNRSICRVHEHWLRLPGDIAAIENERSQSARNSARRLACESQIFVLLIPFGNLTLFRFK